MMSSAGALIGALAIALSLVMTAAWAITLPPGRSGLVDVIWSFAVGGAGLFAALVPLNHDSAPVERRLLVGALVLVWSLRLGLHIAGRTKAGHDDPRYASLREQWGDQFALRSWIFLQIQAAAALLLAGTILVAAHNPAPTLRLQDWLGAITLIIAIAGEATADKALRDFTAIPGNRGKLCEVGLWSISRHPNYFFEWLGWAAYALIAVDFGDSYPVGWCALIAPAFMYWLLVHVSGIPPLEKHMVQSRGAAFAAYQQRVNAFWPGPARRQPDAASQNSSKGTRR